MLIILTKSFEVYTVTFPLIFTVSYISLFIHTAQDETTKETKYYCSNHCPDAKEAHFTRQITLGGTHASNLSKWADTKKKSSN